MFRSGTLTLKITVSQKRDGKRKPSKSLIRTLILQRLQGPFACCSKFVEAATSHSYTEEPNPVLCVSRCSIRPPEKGLSVPYELHLQLTARLQEGVSEKCYILWMIQWNRVSC